MVRNLIRMVAIALIVLPEPTTTVLGMLVLSASFAIPRRSSLRKFGDLDSLVKKSLKNPKVSGFNCYHPFFDNRRVDERVLYHTLKTSFPQYQAPGALQHRH